jgi:molybdopterin/thiamine biosynthesis adenylyltransferase/rhodanese-related sulfurtransferase
MLLGVTLGVVELTELARRLRDGERVVVLDVREPHEHRAARIPGSVLAPRSALARTVAALVPDKATPIVTVCEVGARSALAAQELAALGYLRVERAADGVRAWERLGLPLERDPSPLSDAERARYARHLALAEVGEAGQARLLRARVLVVGAGGLGSPVALYLAAAGVGTLGLVDADRVDATNLQRQIIHGTSRVGRPKVESAKLALAELNPQITVVTYEERLGAGNALRLLAGWDVLVDAADNFPTRYLLGDASVWLGLPLVHGSVHRFEGQVTTFVPGRGPCYRCLFPEPPAAAHAPSCDEVGVLGVLPGTIGMLQATEALKLVLGAGEPLVGRLLIWDALSMRFRELRFERSPSCPVCGDAPTIAEPVDYEAFCARGP